MGEGCLLTEEFLDGSNHVNCLPTSADTKSKSSTIEFIVNNEHAINFYLFFDQTDSQSPAHDAVFGS